MPRPTTCRTLIAVAMLLAVGGELRAQAPGAPEALTPARRSIAVAPLYGGGGELALWRVRSETLNRAVAARVVVAGHAASSEGWEHSALITELALGMLWRRYAGFESAVIPFVQTGAWVEGGYSRGSSTAPGMGAHERETVHGGLRGSAALGAEWFVHPRVSLSAHTGVTARVGVENGSRDFRSVNALATTFLSGVSLQLYF
jgi:hypothetical protein